MKENKWWWVPSALTLCGFGVGMVAIEARVWWLGFVSLAFDVADGATARKLGACSEWGRRLDWSSDVALAYALAFVVFGELYQWPIFAALAAVQTYALATETRVSGRAALTVLWGVWELSK